VAKKQAGNQNSFAKSNEASIQEGGDRDQSAQGLEGERAKGAMAAAANQNPHDYQLQTDTNVYKSQNNMQVDPRASLSRSAKNDNVPSLD